MSKEKTHTTSLGEKHKKFKMPKFPSALVILFGVLLLVVLMSWIPHKGWVDTGNPFLLFQDGKIYGPGGPNSYEWGVFTPVIEGGIIKSITFNLTDEGQRVFSNYLHYQLHMTWVDANAIAKAATKSNAFTITDINLGDDWSQVAINYSHLTFTLQINDALSALLPNVSENGMQVTIDQIFRNGGKVIVTDKDAAATADTMSFAIIKGTINTTIPLYNDKGDIIGTKIIDFNSANIAGGWFNFFDTNYFVGDQDGRYGILNLPFLIIAGVFNGAGIILFMLCTGAFVNVMVQSKALEAGTVSLVNKLKGKELLLLPIFFVLFCFIGTACGMQAAVLGMVPLVVPFLVFAGFDTMTALLVIVVGNTSGIAASILDPFSVGVMSSSLTTVGAPAVEISTGIPIRIIMFFVFAITGSIACTWYGNRSRKGKDFVAEPEMFEANKEWAEEMLGDTKEAHTGLTRRQAIGLGLFAATFGLMLIALLPWTDWFPNLADAGWWRGISAIFFAKVLFGDWFFIQLSFMFLISGLIIGRVFGMKQKETNIAVVKGARGMFGVATILALTRSISLVLTYSGLTTAMIAMMFGGAGGGSFGAMGIAWVLFPVFCLLAIFISSTSGLAAITGPIIAPMLWGLANAKSIADPALDPDKVFLLYAAVVMAVYPLAQGIINMCMPTTGMVVVEADLARVNFGKAFKLLGIAAIAIGLMGMLIITASIPIMMAGL